MKNSIRKKLDYLSFVLVAGVGLCLAIFVLGFIESLF